MRTLKGRNAHKGRTFGGVAACPHCSCPIRVHLAVGRTQAVLDVVVVSHALAPYVPLEVPETGTPSVEGVGSVASATSPTGVPTVGDDIGALPRATQVELFPAEGGFTDDEAPWPV